MINRKPSRAQCKREAASVTATPDDTSSKSKEPNPSQSVWFFIAEYCANSTVHGVRYFTELGRHWCERIWWIWAVVLSLTVCGILIRNLYTKWQVSPVIVSFAQQATPIWKIPFPAVTICPVTKTKNEYLNFTAAYYALQNSDTPNMTDNEFERMEAISQICDMPLTLGFNFANKLTDRMVYDRIAQMALNRDETMLMCQWRNDPVACDTFKPILTEEGICFTFNALNSNEIYRDGMAPDLISVNNNPTALHWSLENGYDKSIPIDPDTYPYRVFGAGTRLGLLTTLLLHEEHIDYLCHGPVQGFKVTLHMPDEVPRVSKQYFRVQSLQEVLVAVKPSMITTSIGLRGYDPNRRQCFFESERQLHFFKFYTQHNCELECLANFTENECGCVKFTMPHFSNTPICGAANIECLHRSIIKLAAKKFADGLLDDIDVIKKGCNCLPACTSILYDAEVSQAKFNWLDTFSAQRINVSNFNRTKPARLQIFFKEGEFISSLRSELYGRTDFLANCGGLLGLFMGVSLLSIVEIIYYCTLRVACTVRGRLTPTLQQHHHCEDASNSIATESTIGRCEKSNEKFNYPI